VLCLNDTDMAHATNLKRRMNASYNYRSFSRAARSAPVPAEASASWCAFEERRMLCPEERATVNYEHSLTRTH
jgi:hypothetical protein